MVHSKPHERINIPCQGLNLGLPQILVSRRPEFFEGLITHSSSRQVQLGVFSPNVLDLPLDGFIVLTCEHFTGREITGEYYSGTT
jgi:hypothetical protein